MTAFFALTTRGLEPVVQAELARIGGVQLGKHAYRQVHATMHGLLHALTSVRSADDLFLAVASWDAIRHTRDMLPEFTGRAGELDLLPALEAIRTVRPVPDPVAFSVTASFVGKRNYAYTEVKSAVAEGIRQRFPSWTNTEDDADAHLNVRVFIEHDRALAGVRLTADPLHRRAYKQTSLAGSLKPPVAAAMIQLARLTPGQTLLDPFCGSGTIPLEATLQGIVALGGDNNPAAVRVSRENAAHVPDQPLLVGWDARRLPLADGCVHAVVSNLPWDRQVEVDASLRALYADAYTEMRRVLSPGGALVLLTPYADLIPDPATDSFEISVYGQNPRVLVFR